MASSTTTQLKDIEHLIFLGKYNDALPLIDGLMEKEGLNKNDLMFLNFYKSDILARKGELRESLEIIEGVLKSSKGIKDSLLPFDALIVKASLLTRLGNHKEAHSCYEKIEQMLESQTNLQAKVLAYRKAMVLESKWWFHFTKGDVDLVKESLNHFLSVAKKSGNKRLISASLSAFAYYLSDIVGNQQLAEEHLDKALVIAEEIDNDYEKAKIYLQYTSIFARRAENKRAEEVCLKGIAIAEKEGFKLHLPMLYFFLGNLYSTLNRFDLALSFCLKSVAFRSSASWQIYPLRIIGLVYHLKGDLELAREYYLKALEICEKIDEKRLQPWLLYNLISLAFDMNDLSKAKNYTEKLGEIVKKSGVLSDDQLYRYASARILKASSNLNDWSEAIKILEELEKEEISYMVRFDISFTLLEIRLKEIQLSPNQEILEELHSQINNLLKEAKDSQYFGIIVEIYRLKSQLALLKFDAKNAVELLNIAKAIAEENGLQLKSQGIVVEQEQLEKQLGMWQQLQKKNTPLDETIKQVKLDNAIKRITQETILEKKDVETGEIIEYRKLFTLKI